jgi:hypothetical protein
VAALQNAVDGMQALTELCTSLERVHLANGPPEDAAAVVASFFSAHAASAELMGFACNAAAELAVKGAAQRTALGTAGVVEAVVAALRAHVRVAPVQHSSCKALLHLTNLCQENKARTLAAGGVQALLTTVAEHAANAHVQAVAWNALANVVCEDEHTALAALAAGAVRAAVASMRAHAADAAVQHVCCMALMNMMAQADGVTRLRALDVGVLDALLAAMRAHPRQSRVQSAASGAVGDLIAETAAVADDARVMARVDNVLAAVVAALAAHRSDGRVQHECCRALWNIMFSAAYRRKARAAHAMPAVLAALRTHPGSWEVQAHGFGALRSFCDDDADGAAEAHAGGAVAAATRALHACDSSAAVVQNVLSALAAMAFESTAICAEVCASAALLTALVATMRAHVGVVSVQVEACSLLLALLSSTDDDGERCASCEGMARALAAAGAVEAAVEASRTRDVTLHRTACFALRSLFDFGEAHADAALRAGLPEAMTWCDAADELMVTVRMQLAQLLRAAAERHDARACDAAGCTRCAGQRARGEVCALPSCSARTRADGSGKRLLRCSACEAEAYCGAAHQRADWGRHKPGCRARAADNARGNKV